MRRISWLLTMTLGSSNTGKAEDSNHSLSNGSGTDHLQGHMMMGRVVEEPEQVAEEPEHVTDPEAAADVGLIEMAAKKNRERFAINKTYSIEVTL